MLTKVHLGRQTKGTLPFSRITGAPSASAPTVERITTTAGGDETISTTAPTGWPDATAFKLGVFKHTAEDPDWEHHRLYYYADIDIVDPDTTGAWWPVADQECILNESFLDAGYLG